MSIYLGTFLIASATLALEVALSRLLSVLTWYHLAFFAISTAMLGMTAGATTVYLNPASFAPERLRGTMARTSLGYSLAVPASLILLCLIPITLTRSIMSLFALLTATAACALPFFFSGIMITAVLTKFDLPIGRIYASDLLGASLGCLLVLGGLETLDAPTVILLCAALGALSGYCFALRRPSSRLHSSLLAFSCLLLISGISNSFTLHGIRPFVVKNQVEKAEEHLVERWNSFSRVVVFKKAEARPQYWGPSPRAPRAIIPQYRMNIDGQAGTTLRRFSSLHDIDHLKFDITNLAYYLRPRGGACIIGVGGGRDIQSAILFGHERVTGIDVNPVFIDLLQNQFRDFAGIADRPEVSLVVDEARSHLSRTNEDFSIIQMSLIDTWAATGAGAFSLSENALYTVEAWKLFLDRLSPDGIFTVSRWYSPRDIGETGRVVSLAVASLLRSNQQDPSRHIAMATVYNISTILVSREPFTFQDVRTLKAVAGDLGYDLAIVPGEPPATPIFQGMVSSASPEELSKAILDAPMNYEPPTDENPYFFNMLRLSQIRPALSADTGVRSGNLIATITLVGLILSLSLIALATIVLPLLFRGRLERATGECPRILPSGALYFCLIGAGFMLVEIALMQRLSLFLGHPVYALGILLFTIILSAGIGSFASDYVPLTRRSWFLLFPMTTAAGIVLLREIITRLQASQMTAPMPVKISAAIASIFPIGILMGFFFPAGMRLVKQAGALETPWYWALNGIFGVLFSAIAVFISIYLGISTNLHLAAVCYFALLPCAIPLTRRPTTPLPGPPGASRTR